MYIYHFIGITGVLLILIIIIIYIFAQNIVRKNLFVVFWITHKLFYVMLVIYIYKYIYIYIYIYAFDSLLNLHANIIIIYINNKMQYYYCIPSQFIILGYDINYWSLLFYTPEYI